MKKLFLVKLFLAVLFIALYTPIAMAANIKIKGAVKDKLSKEPLIGATIRLVGTQAGAVTDLDGNFELNGVGVLEGMYDIEVKYVGYKTEVRRKVRVENGNLVILNLELETDAQELADVVVVAKKNRENENMLLLEQQKAVIAVQAVGVKELSRKGVSDAEGAVSKVAGVSKQEGVKNVFVGSTNAVSSGAHGARELRGDISRQWNNPGAGNARTSTPQAPASSPRPGLTQQNFRS